jgi:hypothetical protein
MYFPSPPVPSPEFAFSYYISRLPLSECFEGLEHLYQLSQLHARHHLLLFSIYPREHVSAIL